MEKPVLKENHNSEDVQIYLNELFKYEKLQEKNNIPQPLDYHKVDLINIIKSCEDYMKYLHSDEYHEDNDYPQYMFEDMMKAVYGKDIFKYIRKLTS